MSSFFFSATAIATPGDSSADEQFNLAFESYRKGDFKQCLEPLNKAISLNPKDDQSYLLLGTVYLQLANYHLAEEKLRQALKINPNNLDAYNNLSLVYFNQKRFEESLDSLQRALRIAPENADALSNLAFIYTQIGQPENALATYKRLIKAQPDAVANYDRLAQLYLSLGKYDEVIGLYRDHGAKHLESDSLYKNLGFAYYYKSDFKQAVLNFNSAKKMNPGDPEIHFALGLLASKNSDLDIAIKEFKQAIKLRPNYLEALQQLAVTYEDLGKYTNALYYHMQILKIIPEDRSAIRNYQAVKMNAVDYYLKRGSKAYFDGDFKMAILSWERVLKLDSKNQNAAKFIQTAKVKLQEKVGEYNARAESFYRRNLHQDAYREWKTALKLDSTNERALDGLKKVNLKQKEKNEITTAQALDHIRKGDVKSALSEFKKTLQVDPQNSVAKQYVSKIQVEQKSEAETYYRKGIELFSKGQLKEAITNLERALDYDAKNQGIKNLLFKARTQLRENIKALTVRGIELSNAGRPAEAREKFTEVLKLDPTNDEASTYLAKMTGKTVQASVSKEEIKKLYYDGVSLYLDGQNRRAIEVWQKILLLDPENQEAKSSITKAEMELKEMEKRGIKTE